MKSPLPIAVRWTGLAAGLLAVGGSGYAMKQLPLWGYWPIAFFLGIWMTYIFLLRWSYVRETRHLVLSTLSGVLLYLAFPYPGITPLIFIAFIPLFLVTRDQVGSEREGRKIFFYAFHTFYLWNALSTFWVMNTAFVAGLTAIGLNSLFMASVYWLAFQTQKRLPSGLLGWLVLPAYWTVFEWLHLHWDLAWPWLNLGNYFAVRTPWVQWYAYTGSFGGAVWIWLVNILGYAWWIARAQEERIPARRLAIWALVALILPMSLGYWQYAHYEEIGKPIQVAVVQPNYEPHYEKFAIPDEEQLHRFLRLSREVLTDSTDYMIFPETSFGPYPSNLLEDEPVIDSLQELVNTHPRLHLLTGLSTYMMYTADNKPAGDFDQYGDKFVAQENSAWQFTANDPPSKYLKSIFVPGAELFPFKRFLPFLRPMVHKLGGAMGDWGKQDHPTAFHGQASNVGPVICYESIFGEYDIGYILDDAEWLAVMTNDGWWDNTPGHRQHAALARLRAIELRRDVVRAANMGWCAFINQRGDMAVANVYGEEAAVQQTIRANDSISYYARVGDFLARIALLISILSAIVAITAKYRKKA
ncbi:MAG: apolipoprotein N-acyltransferase [Saprospiraceae bacterium]